MNEWQPIETAPKDGNQRVLGFVPSYFRGRGGMAILLWQDGQWWDNGAFVTKPSHWMPLPEPPDGGESEDKT